MEKKRVPYAGVFLVFGSAIGAGLGMLYSMMISVPAATYMPLAAGCGAGVGLLLGATLDHHKQRKSTPGR